MKGIIIAGVGLMISGLVFYLQGLTILGPETSFMYSNPQWVTYGIEISIFGCLIFLVGFILNLIKK